MRTTLTLLFSSILMPTLAFTQTTPSRQNGPPDPYAPISAEARAAWVSHNAASPTSLGLGAAGSAWMTAKNWPREWRRSATGFGRRYLDVQGSAAVSSAIEAGLGVVWGEDPRYIRSARQGTGTRLRYAVTTVVVAPRRDGRLAPAWGRLSANLLGNTIENTWLPPSGRTRSQTLARVGYAALDRLAANIWAEFWPDVRQRLRRHPAG